MNLIAPLVLALLAVRPAPVAMPDDQAFLGVFAETSLMKMVGMPEMPEIPDMPDMPDIKLPDGVKLPAGVKLPGQGGPAGMMLPGRPSRKLEVRLWSPGIAPDGATASLAIPDGLKLGPKLDLGLYRPKPEEGKVDDFMPGGTPADFTIKRYWGSSATVRDGQPEIIKWDTLSPEAKAVMREQAKKAQRAHSYYYKPDWTTGYWPTGDAPGTIKKDAALEGHYALTTTYTGNVEIDVPEKVNFLAPLEMSSPDFSKTIDMAKAMEFKWKAVPNVLGYHMAVMGMEGKNTIIIWTSSEIKSDMAVNYDYMQMADVIAKVKETSMMDPKRVDCTCPAGIFKDCDMVFGMMAGFGPGAALDKAQPLPRVQTKTTLQMMLGGKKMKGMMDGMGGE